MALTWPQLGRAWPLLVEGTKKPQEPQEAPRGQSVFVGNLVVQSVFVGVFFLLLLSFTLRLLEPDCIGPDGPGQIDSVDFAAPGQYSTDQGVKC